MQENKCTSYFFDSYAADFNAIYGTSGNSFLKRLINNYLRKSMRLRFKRVVAGCDPIEGLSVLDIGCGPGHYAVSLALGGARKVVGIDFAPTMLQISKKRAEDSGVTQKCAWIQGNFMEHVFDEKFDYVIACGFMDYIENPEKIIEKINSLTKRKAFITFPKSEGILAWQRRLRYKLKCSLYMYSHSEVLKLFEKYNFSLERLDRDYMVIINNAA